LKKCLCGRKHWKNSKVFAGVSIIRNSFSTMGRIEILKRMEKDLCFIALCPPPILENKRKIADN